MNKPCKNLQLRIWESEKTPEAVMFIIHGMAEHIARYEDFAHALNEEGIAVAGIDLPGHGPQTPQEELGYFAPHDGWTHVLETVNEAILAVKKQFPDLPLILFGHSMGSFLAREYVLRYDLPSALVLSGTGHYPSALCLAAGSIAGILCLLGHGKKPSKLLDKLAFSSNNKPFEPVKTACDWLSRDEEQVRRYIADPYCGFVFTAKGYADFFGGLQALTRQRRLKKINPHLPILLVSGDCDPVGSMGKGVLLVAQAFRDAGIKEVEAILYPKARHEILNESNNQEVYHDIINWSAGHIRAKRR